MVNTCLFKDDIFPIIRFNTHDVTHEVVGSSPMGLPFRRTSPDHGTAFDIAGTGRADETSTLNALQMAAQMSAYRA